jgi:hypothetical protein
VANRTFIVRMKHRVAGVYSVVAERMEIHDEHLVLLQSNGRLAGLFHMKAIESWSELPAVLAGARSELH